MLVNGTDESFHTRPFFSHSFFHLAVDSSPARAVFFLVLGNPWQRLPFDRSIFVMPTDGQSWFSRNNAGLHFARQANARVVFRCPFIRGCFTSSFSSQHAAVCGNPTLHVD